MGKRRDNSDLNQPWEDLDENEQAQERQEWENGAPARDDDGNPVR